ncbi:unnamed protein product [Ectocarpus sp. 12 AP-2014]
MLRIPPLLLCSRKIYIIRWVLAKCTAMRNDRIDLLYDPAFPPQEPRYGVPQQQQQSSSELRTSLEHDLAIFSPSTIQSMLSARKQALNSPLFETTTTFTIQRIRGHAYTTGVSRS